MIISQTDETDLICKAHGNLQSAPPPSHPFTVSVLVGRMNSIVVGPGDLSNETKNCKFCDLK